MDKNATPGQPVKVSLSDKLELVCASGDRALCAPLTVEAAIGLAQEISLVTHHVYRTGSPPPSPDVQSALSHAWGWLRIAQDALAKAHGAPNLERLN